MPRKGAPSSLNTTNVAGRKKPAPPSPPSEQSESVEELMSEIEEDEENTSQRPTAANATINQITESSAPKTKSKKRKRKSKKSTNVSFNLYINKVRGQVHPDLSISETGMAVMNSMNADIFQRLCNEAAELARYAKRDTMKPGDIETAIKLLFPGELAKYAVSASQKAINAYMANTGKA